MTDKNRSYIMSQIKGKNTKPEKDLRLLLFSLKLRYRIHYKLLPGVPDIVFTKKKLAIFVHGCFWHYHDGCKNGHIPKSNKSFWEKKFSKNKARDLKNYSKLNDIGWDYLIIWECEINKSLGTVVSRIIKKLNMPENP